MKLANLAAEYILRLRKFDSYMINAFTLIIVAAVAGNAAASDWVTVAELSTASLRLGLALGAIAFLYPIFELVGMWAWGRWDLPRVEVRK